MNTLIELSSRVTHFPELSEAIGSLVSAIERVHFDANVEFLDIERDVGRCVRAVGRAVSQTLLKRWCPHVDEVRVAGVRYRRMRETSVGRYSCVDGQIEVERHLYRRVGVRNGPTVVPLARQQKTVRGHGELSVTRPRTVNSCGKILSNDEIQRTHAESGLQPGS